jgi:DNA ligase (NAD+)
VTRKASDPASRGVGPAPAAPVSAPVRARYEELVTSLGAHDYRYHVLDDPIIPDREYDALYRELVDLEAAFPELRAADSPTRRVGTGPRGAANTLRR